MSSHERRQKMSSHRRRAPHEDLTEVAKSTRPALFTTPKEDGAYFGSHKDKKVYADQKALQELSDYAPKEDGAYFGSHKDKKVYADQKALQELSDYAPKEDDAYFGSHKDKKVYPDQKALQELSDYVNKYELFCVERMAQGRKGPDEEKMTLAFQAYDALIPNLGVYTRIFKKLRDDMHDAVFSDDLTTHDGAITRIPYFTHITRRQNMESEKLDEMEEQLETVKKRLFEKHKQLEESETRNLGLQETLNDLNDDIEGMKSTLADKSAEIERLENELEKEKHERSNERDHLQGDIDDLQNAIAENKEEIKFLSQYKKGYDDLYYAFLDQPDQETPTKRKKPIVSTKRGNLTTNIQLATKLEEQIMTVLNTAVEEFDKFLEEHKDELQGIEPKDDMTDAEFEAQEIDIDNADQQLEAVQERFKNTIGDISNELLLLKQHSTMLMEQLQILEEHHPTISHRGDRMRTGPESLVNKSGDLVVSRQVERRIKRIQEESLKIQETFVDSPYLKDANWQELLDSILSAGLGDDEDEDESDPFIPQERVFAKYAAMVYTSNNQGKSFEEFKDAKYCASCGEKTVVCPHKLPGSERIFSLPHNCTHIKIVRPKVKINKDLVQELLKPADDDMSFDIPSSIGNKFEGSWRGHNSTFSLHSPTTSRDSTMTDSDNQMHYSLHDMFDDFKNRTSLERSIPRHLPFDRCMSVIEQFWTFVIWEDDNGKDDEVHLSISDKLYRFMEERYMVKDIMYLCNFDFLSAVMEYSEQDKMVQLFGNILVGNLEGASFRYMMLLCDFICAVDWHEVEDFRAFASVVYPFLGEDDLETLQMSYTSFSENKISRGMVAQFIIHLILKYREPRFQDMENRLILFQAENSKHPSMSEKEFKDAIDNLLPLTNDTNMENRIIPFQAENSKHPSMSEKDFKDAIDNLLPLTNDKLRRRLFFEAEKFLQKEGINNFVPISRLSQIASYLGLLHITTVVRDTINAKIREWRERPSSSGSARHLTDHESQILHEDSNLVTMTKIKLLSSNISRFAQNLLTTVDHESQILHEGSNLVIMTKIKLLSSNISRRIKLRQDRYDMGDAGSDW